MFFINQPLFLQTSKPLYSNPKYLCLGFEFGPQRIVDLAIALFGRYYTTKRTRQNLLQI